MKSLDPRISRWKVDQQSQSLEKGRLDQLVTFEVFLQMREGKAYEHVGIVHASDLDMAFLFAKEQFSRRYTCTGMWVVATEDVTVTDYTDLEENIYDSIELSSTAAGETEEYQVFHLAKRGKQHKQVGTVSAASADQALVEAKKSYNTGQPVLNVWVAPSRKFWFSSEEDKVIWSTLKEKTHRDVISYKAADKLKAYKEKTQQHGSK